MLSRAKQRIAVGACLLGGVQAACSRAERPPAPRPNILLVTIDTLRADRIGAGVAPTLDRLAASGVRFASARTAAPLTLPSHATIHTGLLPPEHGVRENGTGVLATRHQTIAARLKAAGYQTAAFVGAFVLDRRFGLAQGFDTYDDQIPRDPEATERLEAERPASAVVDRALGWFEQSSVARQQSSVPQSPFPQPPVPVQSQPSPQSPVPQSPVPFFIWIHFYDPHAPYAPPPEYRGRTRTPYDDEVAYADSQLARLLDRLRTHGVLERTLIVIAGDHGEGLGDHGERTHGMLLYDSTLRVPLILAAPGRAAATIDAAVGLSELAPTILRAAGLTPPPEMKGRDLMTVRLKADATYAAEGGVRLPPSRNASADRRSLGEGGQPELYSETEYPRVAGWSPLQALTDGRWKMIRAAGTTEIFDTENDPREEHDVAAAQPAIAAAMGARADTIHGSARAAPAHAVSADAQERLRALGYVASSAQAAPSGDAPPPARTIAVWNDFEDALSALNARRPAALDALKTLAAANPGAAVMQSTYARALKDAGQPLAALATYRRAARRWPTDPTLLHDLSAAAREAAADAAGPLAASLRDEATRADQAALALEPDNAMALNGLGLLAIDDHRPADAAQSFERAAAIDPNNASYWTNLGNARRAAGDRARAEQAYQRALQVDGRAADAANGLGVLLVEANHPADAVAWFERAIAAAPDLVEARLNLGIALQQAGDTTRAADAYRRVLSAPRRYARERDAAAKLLASIGEAR